MIKWDSRSLGLFSLLALLIVGFIFMSGCVTDQNTPNHNLGISNTNSNTSNTNSSISTGSNVSNSNTNTSSNTSITNSTSKNNSATSNMGSTTTSNNSNKGNNTSSFGFNNSPKQEDGVALYPGSHKYDSTTSLLDLDYNFKTHIFKTYTYGVKGASRDDIINWYKSKFPDYSANIGGMDIRGFKQTFLLLKKENTMIGVGAFDDGERIYYCVKKVIAAKDKEFFLPSHDIVSGEEPFERYPGSIMLDYYKSEEEPQRPGDFMAYEITYATYDGYDKVVKWLDNMMKSKGWAFNSKQHLWEKGNDIISINILPALCERWHTKIHFRINFYFG